MSLNEIAVDLTCHPESFQPAQTQDNDIDEEDYEVIETPGDCVTSSSTKECEQKGPSYQVHSGMLRMAKAMGEPGKPVQLAVHEALYHNPGFGEQYMNCGTGILLIQVFRSGALWTQLGSGCCGYPRAGM